MSLLLLEPDEVRPDGSARLAGPRAAVLWEGGLGRPGRELEVGVIGDRVGVGRVVRAAGAEVVLEVRLERDPPPPLPVVLVLAAPEPRTLRRSLDAAASLGVKHIVLLRTWRVPRSHFQTSLLREPNLRPLLAAAVARARDTVLPCIEIAPLFRPFVEDRLPELLAGGRGFVADPDRAGTLPDPPPRPALVAVGPERGFTEWEHECLTGAGLQPVRLGPRILRVEHAVAALLGRWLV